MTVVTSIVFVLVVLGILYRKKETSNEVKKAPTHQCRYKLQIQKVIQ